MTVRVNKPEFNLREKLTELERPIGLKGSELMRAETTQEARDFVSAGRKNFLMNGNFIISQRGDYTTAAVAVTDDLYYLDRWKMRRSTVGATIQRQLVTLPNNQKVYSLNLAATSAGNGYLAIRQVIEDINSLSNQDVTLSCWVRGSGPALYFRHWGATNIGDPIYPTNEWQYVSRRYRFGDVTSLSDGSSSGATMAFTNYDGNVAINSGDYFEIAQFQIEVGKNATEFEHRSIGEELALCQRYYFKSLATRQSIFYKGPLWESNWYSFPVEMRANPTLSGGSWFLRNPGSNSNISYSGFVNTMFRTGFYVTSNTTNTNTLQCWFNDAPLTATAEL